MLPYVNKAFVGEWEVWIYFLGAFRLYDVDNDGYITRQEMYNIVEAIYQMVVSKLGRFSANSLLPAAN